MRHVPPRSVNRCLLIPLPDSTTSKAPVLSKARLRGFVRPAATTWPCHPGPIEGRYQVSGIRMVGQEVSAAAETRAGRRESARCVFIFAVL